MLWNMKGAEQSNSADVDKSVELVSGCELNKRV